MSDVCLHMCLHVKAEPTAHPWDLAKARLSREKTIPPGKVCTLPHLIQNGKSVRGLPNPILSRNPVGPGTSAGCWALGMGLGERLELDQNLRPRPHTPDIHELQAPRCAWDGHFLISISTSE